MSKPADNPAEPFKKALAETTRTMAADRDWSVELVGRMVDADLRG